MLGLIKKLFGPGVDIQEVYQRGASIIDVRTPGEFSSGHIKGSVNIPLDQVSDSMDKIKNMPQPIITCCASGMRSGSAKSMMKSKGLEAYNGGGWASLNQKIKG